MFASTSAPSRWSIVLCPASGSVGAKRLRGATLAAILWEIGRQLLGIYLIHLGYPTAYGVIGSFIAIMLFAYYAMIVVFIGAEYTRVVREENLEHAVHDLR